MADPSAPGPSAGGLRAVALVAFKLGCTAFGGPAAHVALLREEVVVRRRWAGVQHFLDLLGATNLIPGPNSTEMVIHTGYERAGKRGMVVAGVLFILPAALITLVFAWLYVRFGRTPAGEWLLYGVKPVVIAVVVQAIWGLLRAATGTPLLATVGAAALLAVLAGGNELAVLLGCGLLVAVIRGGSERRRVGRTLGLAPLPALPALLSGTAGLVAAAAAVPYDAWRLFLLFLRIGATLYGSGYVLLAFLEGDLVERLGWLTRQQLIDAVAVGQFTPGPVFTTATFVGYVVGGWWGAVLATVGIFLPAFVFVGVLNPLVPRLRRSPWTAGFLDGVNVAAVALMAVVAWTLGRAAIVDVPTALLATVTALALIRLKVNSAWLILGGAVLGLVWRGVGSG